MEGREINNRKEKPKTVLIASYEHKYSKKSLDRIKKIVEKLCPERIMILKIIKEKPDTEIIDAYIGHDEKEKVHTEIQQRKKQQADELASDLINIMDDIEIPYGVHLRTGKDISEEILDVFENQNVVHVIAHRSSKGKLGKLVDPSIADKVTRSLGKSKVTLLE